MFWALRRFFHSETLNRLLILQSCLFGVVVARSVPFFVTGIIRLPLLCGLSVGS